MTKRRWRIGDKKIIARASGISPQQLSNILGRRARALPKQAILLEEVSVALGYDIYREDWIWSKETDNALFAPIEDQDAEA